MWSEEQISGRKFRYSQTNQKVILEVQSRDLITQDSIFMMKLGRNGKSTKFHGGLDV